MWFRLTRGQLEIFGKVVMIAEKALSLDAERRINFQDRVFSQLAKDAPEQNRDGLDFAMAFDDWRDKLLAHRAVNSRSSS